MAIASPPCTSPSHGARASKLVSAIVSCITVVYIADAVDLGRVEGLFEYLGPALERLLAFRTMALGIESEGDGTLRHRPSTLIVVFCAVTDAQKTPSVRKLWESAASQILSAIIQPSGAAKTTKLEYVFDHIDYLLDKEKDVDM